MLDFFLVYTELSLFQSKKYFFGVASEGHNFKLNLTSVQSVFTLHVVLRSENEAITMQVFTDPCITTSMYIFIFHLSSSFSLS